jgi:hypothetical protein
MLGNSLRAFEIAAWTKFQTSESCVPDLVIFSIIIFLTLNNAAIFFLKATVSYVITELRLMLTSVFNESIRSSFLQHSGTTIEEKNWLVDSCSWDKRGMLVQLE